MTSIKPYSKAIVSILGALVVAVMQAFPDSPEVQQWGSIIAALVTAVAVYAVPNRDPQGTHQAESTQPPSASL
jgi:peptidoglycan/LPS O-acetylase OafA/YrhL